MIWICRSSGHRATTFDVLQKADEVPTGVACSGLSVNAAGGSVQCRIQGKGSMPVVFESMALGAAGRKRQNRIQPIQRLNGSLLIDTEHGSMLWRVQVQPDNV